MFLLSLCIFAVSATCTNKIFSFVKSILIIYENLKKIFNFFLVTYRPCVVRVELTAAPRVTFATPSQKSAACQRRRKHGKTRPIGLYKTSCVEKFRTNLKFHRLFANFKSYMIWCIFCDIGQRAN